MGLQRWPFLPESSKKYLLTGSRKDGWRSSVEVEGHGRRGRAGAFWKAYRAYFSTADSYPGPSVVDRPLFRR